MDAKVLQLHKRSSYEFKHIQDKYSISIDGKTFALADGTTQSFKSEIWAEIITKEFTANPTFNPVELIRTFKDQVLQYKSSKFEFSSNLAKSALEKTKQIKGGTSTFIGLHFTTQNKIEVITCGDSNLFLLNSENNVLAFPFPDVDGLDANNYFINTEKLLENKIDETYFRMGTFEYKNNDKVLIVTDALSRLFLKKPETLFELLKIEDFNQLNDFCLKYWESKELQEDDISAIIITVQNNRSVKTIIPSTNFSFPKEKEEEFIPLSLQEKPRHYMETNEIRNQFDGIAQDFHQVKKKLNFHEMLLMLAISLLLVNSFLMYLYLPINAKDETSKTIAQAENVIVDNNKSAIKEFNSETQPLKSNRSDDSQLKEEPNRGNLETLKTSPTISKELAKKRQKELFKAGYKVEVDGIWGAQSERKWNEYLEQKKNKK
jgi:serine/threonine protein phosphatase PrpC